MSKTNNYGSDCILLDTVRRKLMDQAGESLETCRLLVRRIKGIYGHILHPSSYSALAEQREKIDWLIATLEDFREYMEEKRAWAPAEEPKAGHAPDTEVGTAMDDLVAALGPAGPDGPVADSVDGYRILPGEEE